MGSASVPRVSQVVAATWCRALQMDSLPPNANFFLVGGDSLTGVLVATELSQELGTGIGLADLLDAPAFDDFVGRVVDVMAEADDA
jgi:hypothetical protein